MELITQFINDLGNFIFIPVIFLVLMKILGRPLSECIFTTARENSKKNLLEAERNDNALLVKPADVRWNMGFRPDDEKSEG